MDWQKWCSFCAKIESKNCRLDAETKLPYEIHEQFHIFHPNEQIKICEECTTYLKAYNQFKGRCDKVQSMFEIIAYASPDDLKDRKFLHGLRADIGLDSNDDNINEVSMVVEEENPLELKFIQVKCESVDPAELLDTSYITSHDEQILPDNDDNQSNHETSFDEEILSEENVLLPAKRKLRNRFVPKLEMVDIMKTERETVEIFPQRTPIHLLETITPDTDSPNRKLRTRATSDQSNPMKAKRRVIRDIKLQTEFLKLECKFCNAEKFENKRLYEEHMRERHPDQSRIFKCSECSKSFERWSSFRQHEKTHLPDDKRLIISCDYCPKKFSSSWNVEIHIKAVHKKNGKEIVCDQCGKFFISMSALKEHMLSHSAERPFKCDFKNCGKSFKSKVSLAGHQDTHSTVKRICDICGLSLSSRITLLRHMLVHSNAKKFSCKFCNKKFKRSKALKIHLILHTGLRPYSCPFCSFTSANGANFRSHKKKYHADELAKLEASGETLPTVVIPKLRELQSMNTGEQIA